MSARDDRPSQPADSIGRDAAPGFRSGGLTRPPAFVCPSCAAVSHNAREVAKGHYGVCRGFTGGHGASLTAVD
ncbi:MAG: hypothetical protein JWM31_2040 [Solirubrobacterales bacterium]|nr:hypothetical protein [Solirubrobacterales bacterium]